MAVQFLVFSALVPMAFPETPAAEPGEPFTIVATRVLDGVQDLVSSTDGATVAALQAGAVVMLASQNLSPLATFYADRGRPVSIAADPVTSTLAVGTTYGDVVLLEANGGSVLRRFLSTDEEGNWARRLLWAPSGDLLAVELANETLLILSADLKVLDVFPKPNDWQMAWVAWNGSEAVLYASGPSELSVRPIGGTVQLLPSWFIPRAKEDWVMWPNGTGVMLTPTASVKTATITRDFGRHTLSSFTILDDRQDRIVADFRVGRFLTLGNRASTATVWSAGFTPEADISLGYPVLVASWLAGDSIALWTARESGTLYVLSLHPRSETLRVTIDYPAEGSEVNGTITVRGAAIPPARSGIVFVRTDLLNWRRVPGNTTWSTEIDTRPLADGDHSLEAVFWDGSAYSPPARIVIHVNNGYAQGEQQIQVWFQNPHPLEQLAAVTTVSIGVWNPNRANNTVDWVEFSVDRSLWEPATADGSMWRLGFDSRRLPNGFQTLYARAFDGRGYSEPAWVVVNVSNVAGLSALGAWIITPEEGALLVGPTTVRGFLQASAEESAWPAVSVDWGVWIPISGAAGQNWTYPLTVGKTGTPWLFVCVRASTATRVSEPDCRSYRTELPIIDVRPTLEIRMATGTSYAQDRFGITVGGVAADDNAVVAVYVRLDAGSWAVASGTEDWTVSFSGFGPANGAHQVEAMAYDGRSFSVVHARAVSMDINASSPPLEPAESANAVASEPPWPVILILFAAAILGTGVAMVRFSARRKE